MQVQLRRQGGGAIFTPVQLTPTRYSHAAMGGPETAEIVGTGDVAALEDALNWLAADVLISNDAGQPVWWGIVQAVTVSIEGESIGVDASDIVNRMAVVYLDETGAAVATGWTEDAASIAAFGRREARLSANAETSATAEQKAIAHVNRNANPVESLRVATGANGLALSCVGYWATLGWRYWTQDAGQIVQDEDANTTELIGWSVTGEDIGLMQPLSRLAKLTAELHPLVVTDRVVVSGSDSNDGVFEIAEPDERTAQTVYSNSQIYFDASDDVHDDSGLLNQFRPGDLIEIDGASETGNNGLFFVKDFYTQGSGGQYSQMRVYPGTIVDEGPGGSQTITAGNSVGLVQRPVYELPGEEITVAAQAVKLAQSFVVGSAADWELSEVWLTAAKVGAPADTLQVQVCADNSGEPGTVLKTTALAGANLPVLDEMDWQQWTFDHAQTLTAGATYWVVVSRSGSAAGAAYRVGLLESEDGSTDNLLLWDGAAWVARTVASGLEARLALRVFGQRATTTQIEDIVDGVGDLLSGVIIETASGLRTRIYRDAAKAQTALAEVQALLAFGTSAGARLLARVDVSKALVIGQERARAATADYVWRRGELLDKFERPLAEGLLPVGFWVGSGRVRRAPSYLETAEYDVAARAIRPGFRANQAISMLAQLARPTASAELANRLEPFLGGQAGEGVRRITVSNLVRTGSSRPAGGGSGGGGGGGIADHGELSGLGDDDHPQYVLKATWGEHGIVKADTAGAPANMTVPPSTIVGRGAAGGITALTAAQAAAIIQGSIDHGSIAGLTDDDHTGYALLAGRSGGQTLIGGTASGDDLTLRASSHTDGGGVVILQNPGNRVIIRADGTSANSGLDILSERYTQLRVYTAANSAGHSPEWNLYKSRGTLDSPSATVAADTLGALFARGHDGTNYVPSSGIRFFATAINSGSCDGEIRFVAHVGGVDTNHMSLRDGHVGVRTATPTISDGPGVDVNGKILRLRSSKTPSSASDTGNVGEICWDSGALYICVATDTWKKVAIATW